MALTDNKITTWTNPIVNEADRPQRSAADMKAIFDSNSNQLKTALNNLIDALTASGAGDIGAKVEGMSGTTIGTLLTELKSLIDDICDDMDALQSAVLPGNDGTLFLADNGEWKLPSVGAAANGVVAGGAAGSLYVKKSQKVYDAEWKSGHDLGLMFASTYDTDNDGVVDKADDADKLGGKAASKYQPAGTYATPDDVSGAVTGHNGAGNAHSALFSKKQTAPVLSSSLPASGAALTANTIYNVSSPVGTYVFTPPASGWAHGTFSTAASVAVSFVSGANYLGEAPAIEASKTYEFDVYNGVWAVQEVVSA